MEFGLYDYRNVNMDALNKMAAENNSVKKNNSGFDWNNFISTVGNVAGTALKKPDNYTYVTNEQNDSNKILIVGVVAIVVVVLFKFLKK